MDFIDKLDKKLSDKKNKKKLKEEEERRIAKESQSNLTRSRIKQSNYYNNKPTLDWMERWKKNREGLPGFRLGK